jgi:CubicO group peptidase (beta-lactamase class C family)
MTSLASAGQGSSERRLEDGLSRIGRLPYSHSVLVAKHGKTIAERYFHGYSADSPNNLKSVTKSVTSALVGIALERGALKSVDLPVKTFFTDIFSKLNDPKKDVITLRHLLTMSSGLDASDDLPSLDIWSCLDRARCFFERPLIQEPGKAFSYASPGADVVSRVLTQVTGMPTRDFAEKYLFSPLGVHVLGWSRDALGYYSGESELFLTSRDLLKFGVLFGNRGVYEGRRILSEQWIATSTARALQGSSSNGNYGYFWWVSPSAKLPYYYAWGLGGQYVYVVPRTETVIVVTSDFSSRRPQTELRAALEEILLATAGEDPK